MAHEIYINVRGKSSIAYINDKPWHGLGQALTAGASLETWQEEAGMDFLVLPSPLTFLDQTYPDRVALYRNDTLEPLSIVSNKYHAVQPSEVIEFFRDLTDHAGYTLETAGVLGKGAKYWALAKTGQTAEVGKGDRLNGYLLLSTSCDGSMVTQARFTTIRVVCNNTLSAAVRDKSGVVKVSHRTKWTDDTAKQVKNDLGIDTAWEEFMASVDGLASTPIKDEEALDFVVDVLGDPEKDAMEQMLNSKAVATVLQLYHGKARGAELASSHGTVWGLVNAITEYVDYYRLPDNASNRLEYAWFDANNAKDRAFAKAKDLVFA